MKQERTAKVDRWPEIEQLARQVRRGEVCARYAAERCWRSDVLRGFLLHAGGKALSGRYGQAALMQVHYRLNHLPSARLALRRGEDPRGRQWTMLGARRWGELCGDVAAMADALDPLRVIGRAARLVLYGTRLRAERAVRLRWMNRAWLELLYGKAHGWRREAIETQLHELQTTPHKRKDSMMRKKAIKELGTKDAEPKASAEKQQGLDRPTAATQVGVFDTEKPWPVGSSILLESPDNRTNGTLVFARYDPAAHALTVRMPLGKVRAIPVVEWNRDWATSVAEIRFPEADAAGPAQKSELTTQNSPPAGCPIAPTADAPDPFPAPPAAAIGMFPPLGGTVYRFKPGAKVFGRAVPEVLYLADHDELLGLRLTDGDKAGGADWPGKKARIKDEFWNLHLAPLVALVELPKAEEEATRPQPDRAEAPPLADVPGPREESTSPVADDNRKSEIENRKSDAGGTPTGRKDETPSPRAEPPRADSIMVPAADVVVTFNPRVHFETQFLLGLQESVEELGQLQPIVVNEREGRYELISGEQRLRAARSAGKKHIEAKVYRDLDAGTVWRMQQASDGKRRNLDPVEEARSHRRGVELGIPVAEIARVCGTSDDTVRRRLALLDLAPQLQEQVSRGELPTHQAAQIARAKGDEIGQLDLANRCILEKASEALVKDWVDELLGKGQPALPGAAEEDAEMEDEAGGPGGADEEEAVEETRRRLQEGTDEHDRPRTDRKARAETGGSTAEERHRQAKADSDAAVKMKYVAKLLKASVGVSGRFVLLAAPSGAEMKLETAATISVAIGKKTHVVRASRLVIYLSEGDAYKVAGKPLPAGKAGKKK